VVTPDEILAAYRAGQLTYAEAYQRLAYAGERDPRRVLTRQMGWAAVYERPAVGWSR
jgi:hypothetical protein